jgi:hypothetical protein
VVGEHEEMTPELEKELFGPQEDLDCGEEAIEEAGRLSEEARRELQGATTAAQTAEMFRIAGENAHANFVNCIQHYCAVPSSPEEMLAVRDLRAAAIMLIDAAMKAEKENCMISLPTGSLAEKAARVLNSTGHTAEMAGPDKPPPAPEMKVVEEDQALAAQRPRAGETEARAAMRRLIPSLPVPPAGDGEEGEEEEGQVYKGFISMRDARLNKEKAGAALEAEKAAALQAEAQRVFLEEPHSVRVEFTHACDAAI